MTTAEAEKLYEGTDTLVFWYTWEQCPSPIQRIVLDHITARTWTAAGRPSPMVMIQSADRQVQQDVCRAWRSFLTGIFDFEIVVPFGERSIVVWFNQMPAPLAEV
ncbi:MAG: hypothetical protein QGD90_01035 [Candidatus Hydrogenedentes bacterium]|nr:hypothetical protein [Candidatus Hydrogenedentota bacterium]